MRLNIEDALWSDPRFQELLILTGDRYRAKGMVVDLLAVAQKYWIPDRQLIPLEVWKSYRMPQELIDCGLAEKRESGIYAKGSAEHFQWWFDGIEQRSEAGKKSAQRSRDEKGRLLPGKPEDGIVDHDPTAVGQTSNDIQRHPTGVPTTPNEIQPSSSSSFSKTNTNTENPPTPQRGVDEGGPGIPLEFSEDPGPGEEPSFGEEEAPGEGSLFREDPPFREEPINSGIPPDVKAEWEKTLQHYSRKPNWVRDETPLYRIYQKNPDWERIRHALAGYRQEKKTKAYNPAQYVFLHRLEDPGSFDYLESLGELARRNSSPGSDLKTLEDLEMEYGLVKTH